ncbi:MarR family winged helix-turn-helix transcriptional regulator [Feifania hominis]|uniref:MarR family transcriptional regulator n=1 Tax=Feifania hominis TaxID=2763660 RepID=A0A926DD51_9FIRM|nr:MarR family transcriptional regulator [Feifania hominis]MBC8536011.1 MarR family transcriptional regulator [Feifania hominis]
MDLRQRMDRYYLDMVISELRLANRFHNIQHITYNSLLYLDIIAYRENCTVSYLAEALHVAKSAVTLKVKELEKLGLVTKTQSCEDRRVFYLHVNRELLAEYKLYDRVLYRALDEIEQKYTKDEIAVLCDMLDTINHHFMKESNEETDLCTPLREPSPPASS